MAHPVRGAIALPGPDDPALATYRVLDERGVADPARVPEVAPAEWLRMYRGMVVIRTMDERLMAMQRQGRIGFYGEARGQEAAVIGSAAALGPDDWIFPALREAGAGIFRGLPLTAYVAQIMGNAHDPGKGRQMPCHEGTRASKFVTMSSCIATQLPHATGMAWAAKIRGDKTVVAAYLGDGATSESDFHVAMNFAGVFRVPVVFVCQNNQWAISTPSTAQTAAPTIAIKGRAYGIEGVRVDGNDLPAVHRVMRDAVEKARSGGGPTLIEALTYRLGAHTSSDDPSRYRDERVTDEWKARDPISRMRNWLLSQGLLDAAGDEKLRADVDAEVRDAIAAEEGVEGPPVHSLIEDVFAEVPRFLEDELAEMTGSGS